MWRKLQTENRELCNMLVLLHLQQMKDFRSQSVKYNLSVLELKA